MGPTAYRSLKKQGRRFQDGDPVKCGEKTGKILWGRWSIEAYEWYAMVEIEGEEPKLYWFSELEKV